MADLLTAVTSGVVDRVLSIDSRCRRLELGQNLIATVERGVLQRLEQLAELDAADNNLDSVEWVGDCLRLVELALPRNRVYVTSKLFTQRVHRQPPSPTCVLQTACTFIYDCNTTASSSRSCSASLRGIEAAGELERLDVRDNALASLEALAPLAHLPRLRFVALHGNAVLKTVSHEDIRALLPRVEAFDFDGSNAATGTALSTAPHKEVTEMRDTHCIGPSTNDLRDDFHVASDSIPSPHSSVSGTRLSSGSAGAGVVSLSPAGRRTSLPHSKDADCAHNLLIHDGRDAPSSAQMVRVQSMPMRDRHLGRHRDLLRPLDILLHAPATPGNGATDNSDVNVSEESPVVSAARPGESAVARHPSTPPRPHLDLASATSELAAAIKAPFNVDGIGVGDGRGVPSVRCENKQHTARCTTQDNVHGYYIDAEDCRMLRRRTALLEVALSSYEESLGAAESLKELSASNSASSSTGIAINIGEIREQLTIIPRGTGDKPTHAPASSQQDIEQLQPSIDEFLVGARARAYSDLLYGWRSRYVGAELRASALKALHATNEQQVGNCRACGAGFGTATSGLVNEQIMRTIEREVTRCAAELLADGSLASFNAKDCVDFAVLKRACERAEARVQKSGEDARALEEHFAQRMDDIMRRMDDERLQWMAERATLIEQCAAACDARDEALRRAVRFEADAATSAILSARHMSAASSAREAQSQAEADRDAARHALVVAQDACTAIVRTLTQTRDIVTRMDALSAVVSERLSLLASRIAQCADTIRLAVLLRGADTDAANGVTAAVENERVMWATALREQAAWARDMHDERTADSTAVSVKEQVIDAAAEALAAAITATDEVVDSLLVHGQPSSLEFMSSASDGEAETAPLVYPAPIPPAIAMLSNDEAREQLASALIKRNSLRQRLATIMAIDAALRRAYDSALSLRLVRAEASAAVAIASRDAAMSSASACRAEGASERDEARASLARIAASHEQQLVTAHETVRAAQSVAKAAEADAAAMRMEHMAARAEARRLENLLEEMT